MSEIVVTGIGMVTPLGISPPQILQQIEERATAARPPSRFDATAFACPVCAEVPTFDPLPFVPNPKLMRLMNRESQLAVTAAGLALRDAGIRVGETCGPEEICLYGSVGTAGLPLRDVEPLLRASTRPDGVFDPELFGTNGLRAVSPLLSFKILSNMPLCFVSICANLQGANAIYTPWEGQGAQAIQAGIECLRRGDARCAVVGGCDVKTHELAFLGLQQQGVFRSWEEHGRGPVPAEGAVFLVLERMRDAFARQARLRARIAGVVGAVEGGLSPLHGRLSIKGLQPGTLVSCAGGDPGAEGAEQEALRVSGIQAKRTLSPKMYMGDLFSAAAAAQLAVAVLAAEAGGEAAVAHCAGHGSEYGAFLVSPV